jgi:phosphoserine phosphatase RsbU/P
VTSRGRSQPLLPDPVRQTLEEFQRELGLRVTLTQLPEDDPPSQLFPVEPEDAPSRGGGVTREIARRRGPRLELKVQSRSNVSPEAGATLLQSTLERILDFDQEVEFFTHELTVRYEEINLLYNITETLGSTLELEEASHHILGEVCSLMGAQRGSLWVHERMDRRLHLKAAVGVEGFEEPISVDDPNAVTAEVFRQGRPLIGDRTAAHGEIALLSVPVRYTPPSGEARIVGVINLIGREQGGVFTVADEKLLSSIASQVGAAVENNRLIRESLQKERMAQEMAIAHNLQMKLLKGAEEFDRATVGARVVPAEQVGGDFYHLFKLPAGLIGVMIGDVSTHGFPAALIMALSLSASAIYAMEYGTPPEVLRHLDDALREELETTEMYLTVFYGVIDPASGVLSYSNAGHPHAFAIRRDGTAERLLATDPPVGIAGPDAYQESSVAWNQGDLLFLFTDGLSDTLAVDDRRSGERLVIDTVLENRDQPPTEIVAKLFQLAEDATPSIPSDDRTAIVLHT